MSEIKKCFFCEENATYTGLDPLDVVVKILCPNCGVFKITGEVLDLGPVEEYAPVKHLISGLIREKLDIGLELEKITYDNVMSLVNDPLIPKTMTEKLGKIILFFYRNYNYFGSWLEVPLDNCSVGYAKNPIEFQQMIRVLVDKGYLNGDFLTGVKFHFKGQLTFEGMTWGEELLSTNKYSNKVFVAMGFKDDLLKAHTHAIQPACKECGFDAFLISETEHNEGITDRIIAEIKTSKFMVTDFTYNNQGAYFEAGYAQGMGLEVIRTCKKEWFDGKDENGDKNRVHFDINHYSFIIWENYDDLKEKLINRIRATIL